MDTECVALNPCLTCGACCAFFRASFYWAETDDATPGGVPVIMTKQCGPLRCMMLGTEGSHPRCVALKGDIGEQVHCVIYEQRASICREFPASWQDGEYNERCDRARAAWGLQPLTPESWHPTPQPKGWPGKKAA